MTPRGGGAAASADLPSGAAPPAPAAGIDRAVLWSVMLHVLSFPLMLVLLIVAGLVASDMGVQLGGEDDVPTQLAIAGGYALLVLTPLVASVVIGATGWRRRRRKAALAAACVSGAVIVLFLLVLLAVVTSPS